MGCCTPTPSKIIHGAVGIAKALTGTDAAAPEVAQQRRDICRQCEHATRNPDPKYAKFNGLTTFSRCKLCDCVLSLKVKVASEHCPINKW